MKVDTLLTNGVIVSSRDRFNGSIGVLDGKIACLLGADSRIQATKVIDVSGKYIIPGAIDAHAHFQDPGATDREDFEHGTRACAVGGITTVISQPVNNPPVFDTQTYLSTLKGYCDRGLVDYGLHAGGSPKNLENIEALWTDTGAPAIKTMMCYSPEEYGRVNDSQLYQVMESLSKHDGLLYIHAENHDLVEMWAKRFKEEGRKDPLSYHASRPSYVEIEAIQRALIFAEQTGCRVIFAHVSCAESLEMISSARERGLEVYAESCPHFLTFVDQDMIKHGPYLKFSPVMRDDENLQRLWNMLSKGKIHTIGSDHCPYKTEEKAPGELNIWDAPNGIPGLEILLPVLLNGVSQGRISLETVVEVTSYNPSRIFGLYPQKGSLTPGSDADIVIVDMELEKSYSEKDIQSKCKYSPYLTMPFKGWPVITLVRGEVVAQNGEICMAQGHGEYCPRSS